MGSELPRSQPEVEALLVEAIEGNFAMAFTLLSLAALNEGIAATTPPSVERGDSPPPEPFGANASGEIIACCSA